MSQDVGLQRAIFASLQSSNRPAPAPLRSFSRDIRPTVPSSGHRNGIGGGRNSSRSVITRGMPSPTHGRRETLKHEGMRPANHSSIGASSSSSSSSSSSRVPPSHYNPSSPRRSSLSSATTNHNHSGHQSSTSNSSSKGKKGETSKRWVDVEKASGEHAHLWCSSSASDDTVIESDSSHGSVFVVVWNPSFGSSYEELISSQEYDLSFQVSLSRSKASIPREKFGVVLNYYRKSRVTLWMDCEKAQWTVETQGELGSNPSSLLTAKDSNLKPETVFSLKAQLKDQGKTLSLFRDGQPVFPSPIVLPSPPSADRGGLKEELPLRSEDVSRRLKLRCPRKKRASLAQ